MAGSILLSANALGSEDGLNAGCFVSNFGECRLAIERFSVSVDASIDERVSGFRLLRVDPEFQEAPQPLWVHSTARLQDGFSFMPLANYDPTLPFQGFASECGKPVVLSLEVSTRTTGSALDDREVFRSSEIRCPDAVLERPLFRDGFETE